jgi:hypothetical protein
MNLSAEKDGFLFFNFFYLIEKKNKYEIQNKYIF